MSRVKCAGGLEADLSKVDVQKGNKNQQKSKDDVDDEKYHVTDAGRKFLKEQGKKIFSISDHIS